LNERLWWDWLQTIALALILSLVLRATVIDSFRVQGQSMEPTLHDGDRVLISRLSYRLGEPQRGDIVVFRHPTNGARYIKRIIGLPGDVLEIRLGQVLVNQQPLEEPYLARRTPGSFGPVRVPAGTVFVLGDNRANSEDSRVFGFLPLRYIIGKAFLLYWPPSNMHFIR